MYTNKVRKINDDFVDYRRLDLSELFCFPLLIVANK